LRIEDPPHARELDLDGLRIVWRNVFAKMAPVAGTVRDTDQLALRENVSERSIRTLLTLAFLAPDLVKAAVDGRLPRGFGVSRLLVNLSVGTLSGSGAARTLIWEIAQ
jgi:hypothetical protein